MKHFVLAGGLVFLALIWLGPLFGIWRGSFTAHMLAHMGVVGIAAPLIAIGASHYRKTRIDVPVALPILASVIELITVWGWHVPSMRNAAEASLVVTILEQTAFLIVGIVLWWTCFAQPAKPANAAIGAGALLLTSIHMTLLGALLSLSPRPLYGSGEVTCFGIVLSAGEDQQVGGIIMLMVGAVVYLAGGVALAARLLVDPAIAVYRPGISAGDIRPAAGPTQP